jgi:hypothetical protein
MVAFPVFASNRERPLMRPLLFSLLAALALLVPALPAAAVSGQPIGFVKVLQGEAFAQRGSERVPLSLGAAVYRQDICETAKRAQLGISFKDNTLISLGPNSRLTLAAYEFEPAEHRYSAVLQLARGTLLYVSGLIAKLSPQSVQVSTPVANVAVRGTRFTVQVKD